MQLSQLFLEYAQHTQSGVALWLSHPSLEYVHHALPPLCQLWLPHLSLENAHHARPSTSCGYVDSHQSQEYAHHTQPVVAMWLSHPSLEYAHHAHLLGSASCGYMAISPIPGICTPRPARCGYLAISPIPGVCPPCPPLCLCQLWLRGYLTNPWSTHTTPSQVWLSGYLTHPWSTPTTPTSVPTTATWLSHSSLEYAHHAQPGVAMWLSHLSLEYAHHAHLSTPASCGYVAISLIPGVRTPRPAKCGFVAISPIPGVRPPRPPLCICQLWLRGYLTYPGIMPTMPTLLPAVATWFLINPRSTHTTPSQVCLSHLSLEYTLHAHPLPAVAMWLSHLSLEHAHHARPSISCGYVAISLIPGACPPRPPFYQLWLCGFATNPWSTPNTPSHLPGVATRLSPLPLEYARQAYPVSAAATQLSHISLKYTHPIASCGYTTSHLALEYAHHAQPAAGVVVMWPSHFSSAGIQRLASLPPEYALHTQPFRQLWLPYPIPPALS